MRLLVELQANVGDMGPSGVLANVCVWDDGAGQGRPCNAANLQVRVQDVSC